MPELPEVETVVRTLRNAIIGARVNRVVYSSSRISRCNPHGWKAALAGTTIDAVSRRGKYIVLSLAAAGDLVVHLRMTGRFRLYALTTNRGTHDRLIIEIAGGLLAEPGRLVLVDTRQFARADWCVAGEARRHPGLSKLGPEADRVSETELRRILSRSRRPIKSLLLDQTAIAGLGNIYADEALAATGIHPLRPSQMIDRGEVRRLRRSIQHILVAAIEACGTTFDTFSDLSGEAGGFAPFLKVYRRTGEPCRDCGCPISRMVIAGRSAHYCPRCQPES